MTIKEFIEREKEKNSIIGFAIELTYEDLKYSEDNKWMAEKYKNELFGMLKILNLTNYITENEYHELFTNTQEEYRKVIG